MQQEVIKGISMFSSAGIAETYLEDLNIDIRLKVQNYIVVCITIQNNVG